MIQKTIAPEIKVIIMQRLGRGIRYFLIAKHHGNAVGSKAATIQLKRITINKLPVILVSNAPVHYTPGLGFIKVETSTGLRIIISLAVLSIVSLLGHLVLSHQRLNLYMNALLP